MSGRWYGAWEFQTPYGPHRLVESRRSMRPADANLRNLLFFLLGELDYGEPNVVQAMLSLRADIEGGPRHQQLWSHASEGDRQALAAWVERGVQTGRLRFERIPLVRVRPVAHHEGSNTSDVLGPLEGEEHFVGVRLADEKGTPITNSPVRITLPDGSVSTQRTNAAGEVMVRGFEVTGQAKVVLLDYPDPGAAEPVEVPESTDYEVKVVDQVGVEIPGVPLWFQTGDGGQTLRVTDASGVAKYTGTQGQSVAVAFQNPGELSKVMRDYWISMAGATRVGWLLPTEDVAVIEIRNGELVERTAASEGGSDGAPTDASDGGSDASFAQTDASDGGSDGAPTDSSDGGFAQSKAATSDGMKQADSWTLVAGTPFTLSVQPHISLVRLIGMCFDTGKSFLLPNVSTMARIKDIYEAHPNSHLVVVGHADPTESDGDALSLERAKTTLAFLQDEIYIWFEQFGTSTPAARRWGNGETKQMLRGLVARKQGLTSTNIEEYQNWHNALPPENQAWNYELLSTDGKMGDSTLAQLIGDYMNLDGSSLPPDIYPILHGCGASFPMPEPEAGAAWERFSDVRHRRVEFLFFEESLGVQPAPEGDISNASSLDYPYWREEAEEEEIATDDSTRQLVFVEMHDVLFRTDSCVVLPEGEDPTTDAEATDTRNTVGLVATILQYNRLYPGKKLFIAGHTDTIAEDSFNDPLSYERAETVLSLLMGPDYREYFGSLCKNRYDGVDLTQVFFWAAYSLGFDCEPSTHVKRPHPDTVKRFKNAYNDNFDDMFADVEGATRFPEPVTGTEDEALFCAIFDCYEYELRRELDEDADGIRSLRSELVWVDTNYMTQGFGERYPIDNASRDNYRSQSNRRVEVMMFDEGEEPDLAASAADPDSCDVYMPGVYVREHIAMSNGSLDIAWVDVDVPIEEDEPDDTPFEAEPAEEEQADEIAEIVPDDAGLRQLECSTVEGGALASRHGAKHGNVSPGLTWPAPVSPVKEYVLLVVDLNADNYLHWFVSGISGDRLSLPEGAKFATGASPAAEDGTVGGAVISAYYGPEPPGTDEHTYLFRLYGLANAMEQSLGVSDFETLDKQLTGQSVEVFEMTASFKEG